ncbi:signal peptide protein [Rhodopirellula maiorica SM1]|uniref:Signal peptide protein n=2 Tax=Novipirellula TaxID=2795426 RepID=M5RRU9_9BACT|nr:signal peptide protein [Rhodopirellula maiorica SM1]
MIPAANGKVMSRIFLAFTIACFAVSADAHHPDRENQPVHPRIDVIGPLGNRLPESYRRKYNRPTYIGGKIAYCIAPSSREAMAWHKAEHRGSYDKKGCRTVMTYFYPKPWEALKIGPRPSSASQEDGLVQAVEDAADPSVLPDQVTDYLKVDSVHPAPGEAPAPKLQLADPLDLIEE